MRSPKAHGFIACILEISGAPRFNYGNVGVHYVVFGACQPFNLGASRAVIEVSVADEEDFRVAEFEPEHFDALADQCGRGLKIAVYQEVALRRDDKIRGEIFAADIVEVAGDAEGR